LAARAREVRREGDTDELPKIIGELRAENTRLRGEMEYIKTRLPPPIVPPPLRQ